jgi:hypothetical protein
VKFIALIFCLAFSIVTLASVERIKIDSELYINGQLVSTPKVIASQGVPNEIEVKSKSDRTLMKVIATQQENGILLQLDIEYVKDGRRIKSTPKLLVKPNSEASISSEGAGEENLTLKVTANRL